MSLGRTLIPAVNRQRMSLLKKLFWLYFLLLIFEGALRKWVAPQLSAPLLLIRDPVAILILVEAALANKWPERWSVLTGFLTAGMLGLCLIQMVAIGNPWFAALYGLRSYLLPFPVAFVMGENLNDKDLRSFGVCILWLLLPLTALEVAQYLAPFNSFLNAGAYIGAEQIGYTGAHVRASATFSYVVGPIDFNALAAAFVFYGLFNERFSKRWLLWAAAGALVLSIPVIGARTVVFELAGVVVCVAIAAMSGVAQFGKSLKVAIPVLIISVLVSMLPVFSQASVSLKQRFAAGRSAEGGTTQVLEKRTIFPVIEKLEQTDLWNKPLGLGMGQGAAAISKLMIGTPTFVAGEAEFDRAINEMGALPGLAFMLFRLVLTVMIIAAAIQRVRSDMEPLSILFVPALASTLLLGVLEQPTEQGFMVITLAFCLAGLKRAAPCARPAPVVGPGRRRVRYGDAAR